jgi:hypothetical protein
VTHGASAFLPNADAYLGSRYFNMEIVFDLYLPALLQYIAAQMECEYRPSHSP